MDLFTKEHSQSLPTVRIQKAVLDNFKSVEHGELLFDCGRHFIPYGTTSDILGIYGQNGSGKTTFIEVLYILKMLMMGRGVPPIYAECISQNADHARMEFTFDLQYPDGCIRKAVYSCSLKAVQNEEGRTYPGQVDMDSFDVYESGFRLKVYDECLSLGGDIEGKKIRLSPVIDTAGGHPFTPAAKVQELAATDQDRIVALEVGKRLASERSASFIFSPETLSIFKESGLYSPYFQVLLELRHFASFFFYVMDTKSTGFIRLNMGFPLYTRAGILYLMVNKPSTVSQAVYRELQGIFSDIDTVMQQLVPGLCVKIRSISPALMDNGARGEIIEIVTERGGLELPIRDESDGIRKVISVLNLIIAAYNEKSVTIAIDEFDAGIFEYLLGEILQIFEDSGKGQFIFTSHNLRPLEVINKNFLYFTTVNPQNRYIRLKNIGKTNNLRSTYYREIILGEQDETIYEQTQKYKIVDALNRVAKDARERMNKRMEAENGKKE